MENTIMQEVVNNEEVAPVIAQVTKNSAIDGGIIALAVTGGVAVGYVAYKIVKNLKEVHNSKKAEKEDAAKGCVVEVYESEDK